MKRRTPKGIWALRAVTITIALIVILVIGTVAYSAYEDVTAVRSELAGGSHQAVGSRVLQGSAETVSINITVPNRGLYTLSLTVTCRYPTSNVVCQPANVSIPPGQEGVLRFKMVVADINQFNAAADRTVNGTVTADMPPFVTLSVKTDFGSFVSGGGG